jgi:hypothetical protein
MQLVMQPETFDLLVMPNLYGDIMAICLRAWWAGLGIVRKQPGRSSRDFGSGTVQRRISLGSGWRIHGADGSDAC